MRFAFVAICFSFVVTSTWILVCDAATYAPFVRSRYSLRWRTTTTVTPKTNESPTTGSTLRALTSTEALNSVAEKASTRRIPIQPTTKIATTTAATQPIKPTQQNRNEVPPSSTFGYLKYETTQPPLWPHPIWPIVNSTTVLPRERHLHNLAEYDYYDNGDIDEADEKQQS